MPKNDEKTAEGVDSEPKLYSKSDISYLVNKLERLEKENRGLKGLAGRQNLKQAQNTAEIPSGTANNEEKPALVHSFKPWQAVCTDCGERNPAFKDETVCDNGKCGQHLGAVEVAMKLDHCPNCGGKKVKVLNEDAKKRAEEMIHA